MSGSPYRIDTTDFADQVRNYNALPPFNFPSVMFPIKQSKKSSAQVDIHISIYAAHLYDSVILYAKVSILLFFITNIFNSLPFILIQ